MHSPPTLPRAFLLAGSLLVPLLVTPGCVAGPEIPRGSTQDGERPDHLRGIDDNGRIPRAELPADIPHPERWRYKPEGRISDGDVFERFFMSTFIAPFFFFEADVGAGLGVGFTDLDFRNQRRREFFNASVSQTTEGQQNFHGFWRRMLDQRDLPSGGVIQEERSFVQVQAGYQKTLTTRFFGLGAQTQNSDETSYTNEITNISASLQQSFPGPASNWVYGVGAALESRNLAKGFVSTVPDSAALYPGIVSDGDNLDSVWFNAQLRYDTRDSQSNPYKGGMLLLWARGTPLMTGGRNGLVYGTRATWVTPLPSLLHSHGDRSEENPPTDVLGFVFDVTDSSGNLPFWSLPTLGGSNRLRGYIANRFVDNALWFAGGEYRIVMVPRGAQVSEKIRIERIGLALFYGIGSVATDLSSLESSRTWSSYGVGGRMNFERAATFRADLGFGENSTQFTLTYGLSF